MKRAPVGANKCGKYYWKWGWQVSVTICTSFDNSGCFSVLMLQFNNLHICHSAPANPKSRNKVQVFHLITFTLALRGILRGCWRHGAPAVLVKKKAQHFFPQKLSVLIFLSQTQRITHCLNSTISAPASMEKPTRSKWEGDIKWKHRILLPVLNTQVRSNVCKLLCWSIQVFYQWW